ncbi:unnamed protein product [Caenorhabditis angaria]|uniref:ShKT domain-containing protein n=1 Tax=Caenorhabditis angaria TaxID=860376 RepID=A0A9P1MY85_9PELO|nr:unnamed protein product [Caenorhabditis angaria]
MIYLQNVRKSNICVWQKVYRFIMVKNCAKTCDACDEFARLPRRARCRDAFKSCSSWSRNGFCHQTYYTIDERKNFCRKSCKTC